MSGQHPFDPMDLGGTSAEELDAALDVARLLEASAADTSAHATADFADRVMAAIADEPAPSNAGFLVPVHRRGLVAGFADSVRQAWASLAGGGRPAFARASALAYVLVVAIVGSALAGAVTVGVAGALGLIGPTSTQTAPPSTGPIVTPLPSTLPSPTTAPESIPPTVSSAPTPSEEPTASDDHGGGSGPEPSDDHGGNSGPGSSDDHGGGPGPEASDDHGGNSGPDGSDDHGGNSGPGGGSGGDDDGSSGHGDGGTPKPSETPH